jgi:hypothetical protein
MACSGTALALCLHIVTSGLFNEGSVQDGLLLASITHSYSPFTTEFN